MVEPQILNSTVHHSGVFSIQMYTRKSAAFRNALKFNRPISQFLMCPDKLERHGYKISPGTLYPVLHGLEEKGCLTSTEKRSGSTARRFYRATPAGRRALAEAKQKVRELFGELFEDDEPPKLRRRRP